MFIAAKRRHTIARGVSRGKKFSQPYPLRFRDPPGAGRMAGALDGRRNVRLHIRDREIEDRVVNAKTFSEKAMLRER